MAIDPTNILSSFFGAGSPMTANTPLDAMALRGQRKTELQNRLAGAVGAGDPHEAGRDNLLLQFLNGDQHEDEQSIRNPQMEALGKVQDANELYQSPASMDLRNAQMQDKARGEQMDSYATSLGKGSADQAVLGSDQGQHNLDKASARKINETLAPTKYMMGDMGPAGAQPGGGNMVDYWANEATKDPGVLTKLPANIKAAVESRIAQHGGALGTPLTNQTKQMSESANDLLPIMDRVQAMGKELSDAGLFTPGIGTLRNFLANHGMGGMVGMGPDVAQKIGRFNSEVGLLQSGIARAHAGARGAGNTGMAERFEKLLATQGDLPTFLGEMSGVRDLMQQYASHTNPNVQGPGAYVPGAPAAGGGGPQEFDFVNGQLVPRQR